jgi:hypothetical protein
MDVEPLREYADEQAEVWLQLERNIWPNGPAHGSGSGFYTVFKSRLVSRLHAILAEPKPEYSEFSMSTRDLARVRRGTGPGEKADPPASAPGPLDSAAALNHAISESIATTPPRKKRKS